MIILFFRSNNPRIKNRLVKLTGENVVRLLEDDYFAKLKAGIKNEAKEKLAARIKRREVRLVGT